jgi:hypothetical protein
MAHFDGEAALRALADPRRRLMLELVWDREQSPSDLAARCRLSRPAASAVIDGDAVIHEITLPVPVEQAFGMFTDPGSWSAGSASRPAWSRNPAAGSASRSCPARSARASTSSSTRPAAWSHFLARLAAVAAGDDQGAHDGR